MTSRRAFLGGVLAVAAGALVGPTAADRPLKTVWRKTPAGWEAVRMFTLQPGDVFRFDDEAAEHRVTGPPQRDPDGVWSVLAVSPPEAAA